jgi:hypothetical protein
MERAAAATIDPRNRAAAVAKAAAHDRFRFGQQAGSRGGAPDGVLFVGTLNISRGSKGSAGPGFGVVLHHVSDFQAEEIFSTTYYFNAIWVRTYQCNTKKRT